MSWCNAGMKSKPCIIWVLGLFLAIASVDTVPDPPAVRSRAVSVASLLCEAPRSLHDCWLTFDLSVPSLVQVCWIAFTAATDSNPPCDRLVQEGFATDPSPPSV